MSVIIKWASGECPNMPAAIDCLRVVNHANSKNYHQRRCVIGTIRIKPGAIFDIFPYVQIAGRFNRRD